MSNIACKASSSLDKGHETWYAIDGQLWSRWASQPQQDPQWFEIDLGRPTTLKQIGIVWHQADRAADCTVSVSKDGTEWKKVGEVTGATRDNLLDDFAFAAQRGLRHIRINCLKRIAPGQGYSIIHILVNGKKLVAKPPAGKIEAPSAPFRNRKLSPDKRARDLVSRLTMDELLDITGGYAMFFVAPLPRFGLPAISLSDASMGVRLPDGMPIDQTVCFPATVGLAATWNADLASQYGRCIGEECRVYGVHTLLGPGVNIYRTSTNGRNFEYMGEDPFLTSRLAVAYIKALQSTGTMACVKHFACNNNEWLRHDINVVVDERAMQEIYLPAFRAAIAEADVKAVMTAYNFWNGDKASQSRELIDGVLRKELGFKHLVMSDWGAVWKGDKVLASGQDLIMADNRMVRSYLAEHPELKSEIKTQLKRMAYSILKAFMAMGFYDRSHLKPEWKKRIKQHEQVALEAARQAITLLKNDSVLPLSPRKIKSILLTGPTGQKTLHCGGGSADVRGFNRVSYFDGLRKVAGDKAEYKADPSDADLKAADVVIVCPNIWERENADRWFELPEEQEALIRRAVKLNPRTIVVLTQGGGIRMTDWADAAGAILYTYYGGQAIGTALADVLFGKVNPSGKLPFTIEKEFADSPAAGYVEESIWKEHNAQLLGGSQDVKKMTLERGLKLPYNLVYKEGIFVGYRWYDTKGIEPRFCFGHGLSYSSFEYSGLKVPATTKMKRGKLAGTIEVSLSVENTSSRAGTEVVQLYVGDPEASAERPVRELKGFARITLSPGQKKRVKFRLDQSSLAFFHPEDKKWTVEKGTFSVEVGSSSRDIRLTGSFELV